MISESTYTMSSGKSSLATKKGLRECNFDSCICRIFSMEQLGAPVTEIEIKGKIPMVIKTSVVPVVQQIALCEMKVSTSILGMSLRQKGITACRFCEDRIQYLVNIEKLLEHCMEEDFNPAKDFVPEAKND